MAEQIASLHPDIQALYMSGYTDDPVLSKEIIGPAAEFLQKPLTPSVLPKKLREILHRR